MKFFVLFSWTTFLGQFTGSATFSQAWYGTQVISVNTAKTNLKTPVVELVSITRTGGNDSWNYSWYANYGMSTAFDNTTGIYTITMGHAYVTNGSQTFTVTINLYDAG